MQMDPRALERVEEMFREQIDRGLHPGAALAAYRHGRLVLDLYGGLADSESGKPITSDTMFILYSSTKPLAATCLHILKERGKLAWDEPVAKYWPAFAKNGKQAVNIGHILTHQGGFPETPVELTWDKWRDWDLVVRAMEDASIEYEPGTVIAYHHRNFGWVTGELVQRVDGRSFSQFLEEELTGPLGMSDTFVGLPVELEERVSLVHAMEDTDRPGMAWIYNQPEVHQAVHPAGGGIATARDLARFYAMLECGGTLDGVQILRRDTVKEFTKLQVEGLDHSLGRYTYRSLGLALRDYRMGDAAAVNINSFGHGGQGTSVGWADPYSGLGMAYITNGFRSDESNARRLAALSQAVRDACR